MTDKTQLEIDLERKERVKKPGSAFVLIVFFSVSLVVLGIYTIVLKRALTAKENEIMLIKRNCDTEKTGLANKIKNLAEQENGTIQSVAGHSPAASAAIMPSKGN